ncbi:MAG: hypothetical protein WC592_07180 [Candidatus Omnitrophota bacterium]|nr:hypothetical protein [Candidatus Omnitrophota bacterium]
MKKSVLLVAMTGVILMLLSPEPAFAKGQNIIKIYEDTEISEGMDVDDVVSVGGNITVSGRVGNSVVAVGGSVVLKPGAYVGGQVVAVGGEVVKDASAAVAGRITQVYMPNFIPSAATFLKGGWITLWATISLLTLLGFLGLAILLTALIPEHMGTAVNALERSFVKMLLWGVLWTILIVPVAVLLAISIVGVILIPLEILLAALALIIGYIAAAIYIGKNILLSFKKIPPPFVDVVLGILILFLVGFIPVVGAVIKVVFLIAGFGAVLTTRFGTVK